jgi:hypothetical protein
LTQNNNNNSNNILNKVNDNIYLSSLKSIYNSRNKHKIKTSSLTQNKTGYGNNKNQSRIHKNSKDQNFNNYKSYNSNNIPLNQKKYIIKDNNIIEKGRKNSKSKKKSDFAHKVPNQIEELIKKSHKITFHNKNKNSNNVNEEQSKEEKNEEKDIKGENIKNDSFLQRNKEKGDNNNKNILSNTTSVRGDTIKNNINNNRNKNVNLTSKNNSKVKHKKRISNYI